MASEELPQPLIWCLSRIIAGPEMVSALVYVQVFPEVLRILMIPSEPTLFGIPLAKKEASPAPQVWEIPKEQVTSFGFWGSAALLKYLPFLAQDYKLAVTVDGKPVFWRLQLLGDEKAFLKAWAELWPEQITYPGR